MDRAERLFALLDALRRSRRPVTAEYLAENVGVSVRTIYRDIQALVRLGAAIDGEAGIGYLFRPGFFLPPLMFNPSELESLVLGARWVEGQGDAELANAATNALEKIAVALPANLRDLVDDTGLYASPGTGKPNRLAVLTCIREAIRREQTLTIEYEDEKSARSDRVIWPIALAFYDDHPTIGAWCELRQDFRNFRADRIVAARAGMRYPKRRAVLFKAYLRQLETTA